MNQVNDETYGINHGNEFKKIQIIRKLREAEVEISTGFKFSIAGIAVLYQGRSFTPASDSVYSS